MRRLPDIKEFSLLCCPSFVLAKYSITKGLCQRHSSSACLSIIVGPYG